jgi:DUF438 domain-containing protein
MTRRWNDLLMEDHQTTEKVIAAMENALASPKGPSRELAASVLDYFTVYVDRCHNQKEEQHLFPLIESRGVPRNGGPLGVMLQEHARAKELLAELTPLAKSYAGGDVRALTGLRKVFGEYGTLLKDHFWKENDILYPMALRVLSEADGAKIVAGITALEESLGKGTHERYYALAAEIADAGAVKDLSHGVERDVLAAMLNALPVEISLIDADDTVRYFSHENHDKIFARSRSAIGTKVQNCHPQKSLHMVNEIIADFRAGKRAVAEFWLDLGPKKVHVRYFPVRSPTGTYLGTMEVVQDVTPIQKLSGQKRLLDG